MVGGFFLCMCNCVCVQPIKGASMSPTSRQWLVAWFLVYFRHLSCLKKLPYVLARMHTHTHTHTHAHTHKHTHTTCYLQP